MKYSIKSQIIGDKNSEKKCPIRMRISFAGMRVDLRLGLSVPGICWNHVKEEAQSRRADYKQLCQEVNARLHEITSRIDQLFARCEFVDKRPPTINELKAIVDNRVSTSRIADVFEDYLRENRHLEPHTVQSYRTALSNIQKFRGNPYINEITKDTVSKMVADMSESSKASSVNIFVVRLRTILKFAAKKGIYTNDGLDYKFKFKLIRRVIVYLTREEIMSMLNYKPGSEPEARVRLTFLWCCFTGMRISDAYALTWNNIKNGRVEFITKKTTDPLIVELNKSRSGFSTRQRTIRTPRAECSSGCTATPTPTT